MANKWIINDNRLCIGSAIDYHRELITSHMDQNKTIGGGWWYHDHRNKIVYFYGGSDDFGKVTKEQFDSAFDNSFIHPDWDDCKIIFSNLDIIADVIVQNS